MEKPKGIVGRIYDSSLASLGRAATVGTVLVVLGVMLVGLWQQYRGRNDVIPEHFKVPAELEKVGWKPEVIASKLADDIKSISENADSSVGSNVGVSTMTGAEAKKSGVTAGKSIFRPINFALASAESSLDIEVPQTRITVKSIFRYLSESLGMHPTRISGEITSRGNNLILTIRVSEGGTTTPLPVVQSDAGTPEALLSEGARSIYKHIRPVILASYLYSTNPSDTKAATELILRHRRVRPGRRQRRTLRARLHQLGGRPAGQERLRVGGEQGA
jgi:hypothetical protein